VAEARFWPPDAPGREGERRNGEDRRHEPAGNLVRQALDGRARPLCLGHHLDDARQHRVMPDLVGADHQRPGLVQRAADHLVSGRFADRHGFACHHGFVERGAAVLDGAVDWHLFAWPNAQAVAHRDHLEPDLFLVSARTDAPRRLWCEVEQRLDRARSALAGAQFQNLPEQDEHGDYRGRFEIDGHRAVRRPEGGGEDPRRERRDHAVGPGHARSHRDEREHVEVVRPERRPAAHEERPAGPEDDRSGQRELDPGRRLHRNEMMKCGHDMPAHLKHQHR
jgi:hypothetical protein